MELSSWSFLIKIKILNYRVKIVIYFYDEKLKTTFFCQTNHIYSKYLKQLQKWKYIKCIEFSSKHSYMVSRMKYLLYWKFKLSDFFSNVVLLIEFIFLNKMDTHCIGKNAFKIYINHLHKNSITLYSKTKCQKYRLRLLLCWNTLFSWTIQMYCLFTSLLIKIFLFLLLQDCITLSRSLTS